LELDVERICDDNQPDATATFDNTEQVHHALEQLPLLQREALTLFFLQELSLEEMAVLLGVPMGTVKSRLHYAKKAIRTILSQGDHHVGTIRGISSKASGRTGDFSASAGFLAEGT
jgi:RNA polymerase sigma-70 factor (ECF subfamily)